MDIFSKFLILDNEWQRKSQPQNSRARASRHTSFANAYIP